MLDLNATLLPVDDLYRRSDARPLNDDAVAAIAQSIQEVGGLINPIRVRPRDLGGYEIIAGSHRFAAVDSLGMPEVPCIIVRDDNLRAELAMIDENLCRAELTPSERAQQTARRKTIYEELHPETKHGGDRKPDPAPRDDDSDSPFGDDDADQVANLAASKSSTFSESTAKATGKSERSVQRDAERGEKVCDDAFAIIRGTKLDTGAYLDKLKKLSPNEQVTAAKRDLAFEKKKDKPAKKKAPPPQPKPEPRNIPASFDELTNILDRLIPLTPLEYLDLCPPNRRAALCQLLSGLADVFHQVIEDATA